MAERSNAGGVGALLPRILFLLILLIILMPMVVVLFVDIIGKKRYFIFDRGILLGEVTETSPSVTYTAGAEFKQIRDAALEFAESNPKAFSNWPPTLIFQLEKAVADAEAEGKGKGKGKGKGVPC